MKNILIWGLSTVLLSCQSTDSTPPVNVEEEIRAVEAAFNQKAQDEGLKAAFTYFAAEEATLIRNSKYIEGKSAIAAHFDQQTLSDVSLTWKPDRIWVATSGDMAYSFGKYLFTARDSVRGEQVSSEGVFRTLWKKQPDGQWRYLVD